MKISAFDNFAINDNKYEIRSENFTISEESNETLHEESSEEFIAHKKFYVTVVEPRICTWDYLTKTEVESLLNIAKSEEIRHFFGQKLKKNIRGGTKIVFKELMCSATKFCKKSQFSLEQTATVLSQFYLTHVFFTSSKDMGPLKTYQYFKELQFCHSLPFPPKNVKLFNLEQAKQIIVFFCKVYLRNLPLIRFIALPNFTLKVDYYIEPEKPLGKKKKGKGKKGKKKGKKKK